jgi:hypothetical protein
MEIKQGISSEMQDTVIDWVYSFFTTYMDSSYFRYYLKKTTNWETSALLMDGDVIKGAYLLGDTPIGIYSPVWNEKYSKLKGIEGVLLVIDDSIRNQGWGNKLKDYPKSLGVDYIWGQQFKGLNNLKDWLKRRELITTTRDCYITLELF